MPKKAQKEPKRQGKAQEENMEALRSEAATEERGLTAGEREHEEERGITAVEGTEEADGERGAFCHIPHPKKRAMLRAIIEACGRIRPAARLAKIDNTTHYIWARDDKEYAEAVETAKEMAAIAAEDEIIRRGVLGFDEPVHYQGKRVDVVRKYSDNLLMFYAKGRWPSKYRDNYSPGINLGISGNVNLSLGVPRPEDSPIDIEAKPSK